ncbi:hypothetical protein AURDEDRAFT_175776 [Auricularia subglabra TFB-10046 SS5]|uniref:Uncharacterized protein n=1 Tax=Auricularia subglabra (strain TFB-10046 / SS5) TaxID=717982 RepID=J0WR48_AURST|nr:hypothetical protein AURDEDRAFT_175776 [Auricularia subglabra TFB-10046 SS5]
MSTTSDTPLKDTPLIASLLSPLVIYIRSAQLPDSDLNRHISIRSTRTKCIRTFRGSQSWDLRNVLEYLHKADDVRCDVGLLELLLYHCIGRTLPALRVLHIICPSLSSGLHLWTPAGVYLWGIHCPLLDEVQLHSRDGLRVEAAQLVRLVRDILPHRERRPRLQVCGPITWRERDAAERLNEAFDYIEHRPFDAFILACYPQK